MFSKKSDEWSTPQDLYDRLNVEFNFTLDPCSTDGNCKCVVHFTKENDGLRLPWTTYRAFCNPPYSQIKDWVAKADHEFKKSGVLTAMLIPSRTDTRWFHEYIYQKPNVEIRFIKGRLKFGDSKNSAPFPSMIVIWR